VRGDRGDQPVTLALRPSRKVSMVEPGAGGRLVRIQSPRPAASSNRCGTSGCAASCGGRPVSMRVFMRTRSASRLRFGSAPNAAATPWPAQPPGGLQDMRMCSRVRPSPAVSKRTIPACANGAPSMVRQANASFGTNAETSTSNSTGTPAVPTRSSATGVRGCLAVLPVPAT
jgi:hypothetical protein